VHDDLVRGDPVRVERPLIAVLSIVVAKCNRYGEGELMGRFTYWMNVSLDLRIEQAPGEKGGGEWLRIGEELHREFNARARALALMVQGRIIYETMEGFWPQARDDASLPDFLREYGEIWTAKPKVLVSRTRDSAGHNTRIIGGDDAIEQLAALRAGTDGTIGVGGATVATELLRAGLLDELLLFTHPVILGGGRPLFDEHEAPVQLELLEQRSFDQGVTMHRYAIGERKTG
jgi:dihydrofolate reductase